MTEKILSTPRSEILDLLTRVHSAGQPIDMAGGDFDARLPADLWRELTDLHAKMLYESAQSEKRRIPNVDDLTVQELQALQSRIYLLLQHKVLGDPSKGVTIRVCSCGYPNAVCPGTQTDCVYKVTR